MKAKSFYTVKDIMEEFDVSAITVYRWHALARQGKHRFPLPIGDRKQKLRWSREAILAYLNASTPQASPTIESAAHRAKRHNAALASLRSKGVKVTTQNQNQET